MTVSSISAYPGLFRSTDTPDPIQRAEQALRRLDLRVGPGRELSDLVRLDASSLGILLREVEQEWNRLDESLQRGNQAVAGLKDVEESLSEILKRVQTNTRPGTSAVVRRENQKHIDDQLKKIDQTIGKSVDAAGRPIFRTDAPLEAGSDKLELDGVLIQKLGRTIVRGRPVSLMDLASRKALDSSTRRTPSAPTVVERSMDMVQSLRKDIEDFMKTKVHPRLADVAEVTAGLMETSTSQRIGSDEQAQRLVRELRVLTLKSTAVATAIGANGWDRQRIEQLLK